jgi:ADP-heptose:LPS heptosyltransferase
MKILKKFIDSIWKIKIAFWWQIAGFFIKPKQADLKKLIADGQINNILIAELNFIGDKLFITPSLRAIKKQYPRVKITVLVKDKLTRSVLEENPYIDRLETAPSYFRLCVFSLKNRGKFDLLIDYSANLYYAFLLTLAKIPYRIGAKPQQKILFKPRNGFGWVYTHTKDFSSHMYIADYFLSLLQFLGINSTDNRLEIYLDAKDKQKANQLLKQHDLKENQFIVLHPGVNDSGKAWAIENWQILADKLIEQYIVIFTGSQQDQNLIADICIGLEPSQTINLTGQLNIRETAALISQARAFIGVDTGPLHLAVALNKPIAALFNATHPQNYLPDRGNIIILNTPEKCKQHFTLDYIKTKRKYKLKECSSLIKPEQVYTAIEKLVK